MRNDHNLTTLKQFWQLRPFRFAVYLTCFICLGYFSNSISTSACEQATNRWLKIRLAEHSTKAVGTHGFAQPPNSSLPWIVTVDYQWSAGNTGGEWGRKYYFSFLGLACPIRNQVLMMS